jgi:hypothetical protein
MSEATSITKLDQSPTPKSGQVVPPLPRISRNLDEVAGWLTELAALYRAARRGQIPTEQATRLGYLCGVAAKLAKDLEELKRAEAIHAQLVRLRSDQTYPHIPNVEDVTAMEAQLDKDEAA